MTLGGRKLDFAVFMVFIMSALLWAGKLRSGDFSDIMMATVAAFSGANAWQAIGTMKRNYSGTERRSPVARSGIVTNRPIANHDSVE